MKNNKLENNIPIVFLDIDGVIEINGKIKQEPSRELHQLIEETKPEIVVTSA